MPADHGARLEDRRGSPDPDHNHYCRGNRNRRCRLHRDAQRAVVGILVDRMHMRYLDHGQQRQQDKTHHGRHSESSGLSTALRAEFCLQCGQQFILTFKDTQNMTLQVWSRLHIFFQILATQSKPRPPRFVYTVDR